jgi:hypothetical protein
MIDEVHTLIGAGAAEGAIDAANILKPALARGELQCIGATTLDEYRKHIEKDPALERCAAQPAPLQACPPPSPCWQPRPARLCQQQGPAPFPPARRLADRVPPADRAPPPPLPSPPRSRFQPVVVPEPTVDEAYEILQGLRERYEAHHKLRYLDEALLAAAKYSSQYISDRFLPDKAIDLIDEAGSRVGRSACTCCCLHDAEGGLLEATRARPPGSCAAPCLQAEAWGPGCCRHSASAALLLLTPCSALRAQVRLRHIQLPEEARDLDKELRAVTKEKDASVRCAARRWLADGVGSRAVLSSARQQGSQAAEQPSRRRSAALAAGGRPEAVWPLQRAHWGCSPQPPSAPPSPRPSSPPLIAC